MQGVQAPRHRVGPKWHRTSGGDAAFLADAYGLTPDEWQQLVLDDWLGEDRKGRLTSGSTALAVPRQNGKNAVLEIVELFKMVVQGRKVLHTAHEVKTARKAFLRLAGFFENERKYPELAELVKAIRKTNGQEAIILHTQECPRGSSCDCRDGPSVEFVARSRGSGRGYTVDDLVCDEAQELTDEQLESLLPTISSAPSGDPQQIYTGTPPVPRGVGEVFARLRSNAVGGKTKRVAWIEWSVPDDIMPDEALRSWKENAYSTNPALGGRLNIQTVTDELAAMSPEGFCRERLGWWESAKAGKQAVSPAAWDALKVDARNAPQDGRSVFAVKFAPDGSGVALAGAVRPKDGPVHVEAIEQRPMSDGTEWLVDFLVERHQETAQIVIDGKYGVGFLVQALKDAGVKNKRLILLPNLAQVVSAHSMFLQAVKSGDLSTVQQDEVDEQVSMTEFRDIGKDGGFGWQASGEGSVLMVEAMTYAFWGAKITKRNPSAGAGQLEVF